MTHVQQNMPTQNILSACGTEHIHCKMYEQHVNEQIKMYANEPSMTSFIYDHSSIESSRAKIDQSFITDFY